MTLWVYYEIDAGCRVTPRELGGLLRHFHDCAAPDGDRVGPWEPFALIRPRWDGARRDGIEQSLIDPLEALLASLESCVPDVVSTLGTGVIHGDMHYGNVMCLPGRRLLLIDFDQISAGPLEWDLVPNLVTYRRFGMSDEDYERAVSSGQCTAHLGLGAGGSVSLIAIGQAPDLPNSPIPTPA